MKPYFKALVLVISIILFTYLAFAFTLAEFNPFHWEQIQRGALSAFSVLFFILVLPIGEIFKN